MTNNIKKSKIKDLDEIILNPEKYCYNISIDKLVNLLKKLSDFYYKDQQLVNDDVFDKILEILKKKDPNNNFLFQTGVNNISRDDIDLPFNMTSLDKIKIKKQIINWFNKYKGPYIISEKLDGISMQLYKDKNGNIKFYSKKQTNIGTDKSYLIKYFFNEKILNKIPLNTSIRGEVVIKKKDFKQFNQTYKNTRSVMAGLINTEKIDKRIAKSAIFVVHSILYPKYIFSKQFKIIKNIGLNLVWNKKKNNNIDIDINYLTNFLNDRKKKSLFDIDGIVISDDSQKYNITNNNPKYSFAFKIHHEDDMKNVIIKRVIWLPSMYGYLNPIIQIYPTKMTDNVIITYITAHNANFIKKNKIGKGSIIKIIRSGNVIPYILDIIKPNDKPDMPDIDYKWNKTEIDIIVVNPDKKIKKIIEIKKNIHFFKTIKVKFINIGIITKLYDSGYTNIFSIINAEKNRDKKLYNINGLGIKVITKIYNEIKKKLENIKLYELMSGSLKFGRNLGVKKLKEIVNTHPNILKYSNQSNKKIFNLILNIKGFSYKLAKQFTSRLKIFNLFLSKLKKNSSVNFNFNIKKSNKNKFLNQIIVFTGFRNDKILDFIENNKGKVTNSVSNKTTLVIYKKYDSKNNKLKNAKMKNIKIISYDDFVKKFLK